MKNTKFRIIDQQMNATHHLKKNLAPLVPLVVFALQGMY
jgi:hypothetical protein